MAVLSKKALSIEGSINQEGGIQRVVLVKALSRRCGCNASGYLPDTHLRMSKYLTSICPDEESNTI